MKCASMCRCGRTASPDGAAYQWPNENAPAEWWSIGIPRKPLPLGHSSLILRRPIQESLDGPRQPQLLRDVRRLLELRAQALRLGHVVVAQAALDLELGILLGQPAQPL